VFFESTMHFKDSAMIYDGNQNYQSPLSLLSMPYFLTTVSIMFALFTSIMILGFLFSLSYGRHKIRNHGL
jgi:hypothetical protein